MPLLELDITDKMMEKLQKRAEACVVEPSDVAKSIISCALARREKPCWMDYLTTITRRISEAMIAASNMEAKESKQQ